MNEKGFQTEENELKQKKQYETPRVLASYNKEEMEAAMQPEGVEIGGCGCGSCGCGG